MVREMVRGMKGEDVRTLQHGLNDHFGVRRPRLDPDGDFGSRTLAAVQAFQEGNPGTGKTSGQPDGIVGSRTLRRLFPMVGYTVNIYAMRLKMPDYRPRLGIQPPNLGPGPLRPPGTPLPGPRINPQPAQQVNWSLLLPGMFNPKLDFKPTKFPGLAKPLPIPPPRPISGSGLPNLLPRPFQIARPNNFELGAGGKFSTGKPPETTASISVSAVYVMGDFIPHYEFQTGFELGSPNLTDKNEGWTFGWFAQFAAVDFFWKYGRFHLAQPYGQLGVDATSKGMVLKGGITPLNIDFDVIKGLSINAQGGFVAGWNLKNGEVQAGFETGVGVTVSTEIFDP
jgi:peptidoglycan hydrolase-like protein with peptidoglycan-binding domain